jgi:SAM-dependent methyltransferase
MRTVGDPTPEGLARSARSYEAFFRAHLPEDRGAAIIDVGCGYGPLLHWLQRLGYKNSCGVDASPEMAAAARRLGADGVEPGDAAAFLARHERSFERIFALDVLEHLRKDEVLPFLDACLAALRPGGQLIIQTVNAEAFGWGRIRYGDFTHENAFTPGSLSQVLLACGFVSLSAFPTRPFGTGVRALLRRLTWRIIEQGARIYLHAATGSGLIRSTHIFTDNFIACAARPL